MSTASKSKSTFQKRPVTSDRVAAVELAAAGSPIVGDPRIAIPASAQLHAIDVPAKVGSSQDSTTGTPGFISGGAQVGGIYEVPLNLLTSNPVPPRALYTSDAVDKKTEEMKLNGQITAATGYLNDQGGVTIIDGETRFRGARAGGLPTLRVEIREKPESDRLLYERARSANVARQDQTPLDDAIRWKDMLSKGLYRSQVDLAQALGLGEDLVSRTLKLATLPMLIIHVVAESPELLNLKMLNALREYWEIKGDDETLELVLEVVKTGLGYRDVLLRRKSAEKGAVKRPRAMSESVAFKGAKGEIKSFDKDGRLELVIKGLSAESSEELMGKIRALFAKELA